MLRPIEFMVGLYECPSCNAFVAFEIEGCTECSQKFEWGGKENENKMVSKKSRTCYQVAGL